LLAQISGQLDTDVVKRLNRSIRISAAIVVIAGMSWFGLKQYRNHIYCKRRNAAFARQVETIRQDAHEGLKIGTKKAEVSRFFAEHGIPCTIVDSQAYGTMQTSGCAPLGCGTDSAVIGIRVKLDPAGTVTEEPIIVSLYTDCL